MSGLCLGDVVLVKVAKKNRDWGFNPCPDGVTGKVVGFGSIHYGRLGSSRIDPGKYRNRWWPKIKLETGKEITLSSCHVALFDSSDRKEKPISSLPTPEEKKRDFLEPLPDLPFWEGDVVKLDSWPQHEECFINHINYGYIGMFCNDGVTPMPPYAVSPTKKGGSYTSVREDNLTLIRRGNCWKYYHDEPLEFEDIHEEATFFQSLGHCRDVCNPTNGLFSWTLEEALEAIRSGIAHSIGVSPAMLGMDCKTDVYLFDDPDLGRRLAEATLAGFKKG